MSLTGESIRPLSAGHLDTSAKIFFHLPVYTGVTKSLGIAVFISGVLLTVGPLVIAYLRRRRLRVPLRKFLEERQELSDRYSILRDKVMVGGRFSVTGPSARVVMQLETALGELSEREEAVSTEIVEAKQATPASLAEILNKELTYTLSTSMGEKTVTSSWQSALDDLIQALGLELYAVSLGREDLIVGAKKRGDTFANIQLAGVSEENMRNVQEEVERRRNPRKRRAKLDREDSVTELVSDSNPAISRQATENIS